MEELGLIAKNVRFWMDSRQIGQKALALKAGVNETYVRDILRGRSLNPTESRLRKVADALDCRVSDLTGDFEENGAVTNLEAIGRRVAKLRRDANLTQDELDDIIGVARGTIGSIETGGNRGGIVTTIAIADYFKVPMDWLLCREVPPGGPFVGEFIENRNELAIVAFWRGLTPEEQVAAAKMLRIPDIGQARA
jgi:transcriptional regulator with XRE-family HTH domain